MALPLSLDLRTRIVSLYENGEGSIRDLAERFRVGKTTILNLLARKKTTGDVQPSPHSGGTPTRKIQTEHEEALKRCLRAQPDLTNSELVERLVAEFGDHMRIHPSQISRILIRIGYTRKKSPYPAHGSTTRTSKAAASLGSAS